MDAWDGSAAYQGDSFSCTALFMLLYVFTFCIILSINYHIKVVRMVACYPETIFTMLLSAVIGWIVNYSSHVDVFNTFRYELFFYVLIAPVIFHSSFQMNFGLFKRFFLEIFVLANVGTVMTVISALIIVPVSCILLLYTIDPCWDRNIYRYDVVRSMMGSLLGSYNNLV